MMFTNGLKKAINLAGGQTALAAKIGKRQSHVSTWLHRDKKVPAEWVIAVAAATDWQVTPHQLRADVYPHQDDGLPNDLRGVAA